MHEFITPAGERLSWPVPVPALQPSLFSRNLCEHLAVMEALEVLQQPVEDTAALLARCLADGGKLMLCGNGGSAADCQHIAAELTGRFLHERRPLPAIALTTDTSALTCIGNDYGFADIFARQVQALGRRGDCLVAISTSGRSDNVLKAVDAARTQGMHTVALSGRDGGSIAQACEHAVVVPCDTTARIQEAHIFIGHTWCGLIEQALGL